MTRLTQEHKEKIKTYILNGITSEDKELKTDKEKLEYAFNRFKSEYGFNIPRMGLFKSYSEWLQGLALDYAFYNDKILELAKEWGQELKTMRQEDKILSQYWDFLTNQTFKLFKHYKININ